MAKTHAYPIDLHWTGNTGDGTARYDGYRRDFRVEAAGKPALDGSADPAFRGDPARHNPEDLFVAAIAACHMLFYLALCAREGVRVLAYEDHAEGCMDILADGGGRFAEVCLRPRVIVAAGADGALAHALHATAHERCFIANSCDVPIHCLPTVEVVAVAGEVP